MVGSKLLSCRTVSIRLPGSIESASKTPTGGGTMTPQGCWRRGFCAMRYTSAVRPLLNVLVTTTCLKCTLVPAMTPANNSG